MASRPDTIGPYRLLRPLGEGGMGIVFLAEHSSTRQRVALKTVRVPRASLLLSIRREIHVLARLSHPGIVRVLDEGVAEGLPWYAMELLEGASLRTLQLEGSLAGSSHPVAESVPQGSTVAATIEEAFSSGTPTIVMGKEEARLPSSREPAGKMPLVEAATLVRRLCAPLAYLHGEGIVHRDLKPENVLVRDGWPVLLDFGLLSMPATLSGRDVLELAGQVAGTVWYMAPEQARGEPVDARADLYALGCILYELLTGRPPFTGESHVAVMRQHVAAIPQPPSQLVAGLPPEVDALLGTLLAKEPSERLGHAEDLARALAEIGGENGTPGPRPRPYLYRARFAGRREELSLLRERLESARDGRGGMVLIGGPSGVGKTRLALELSTYAVRHGVEVRTVACGLAAATGTEGGGPALALRALLEALADGCREAGAAETERVLGARGMVLAALEPSLALLPGVREHPAPVELPADAARERIFASLTQAFARLARKRTQLLIVDDVARADELTLAWLRHLARTNAPARLSLLLVATYRSEEAGPALGELLASASVQRVDLRAMAAEPLEEIVGDMLARHPPPEALARALAIRAEGNPFFVAEYLRAALAEGLIDRDTRGHWVARSSEDAWPATIQELLSRRLRPLGTAARQLLDVAACLGREESWDVLAAASPLSEDEHLQAMHELLRASVLEELPGGRYGFAHDRLREVAERAIPADRVAEVHGRAARALDVLPPERRLPRLAALATHWERAGDPGRARPLHLQAARRAVSAYALAEAERSYVAYLALTPSPSPERLAALQELGDKVRRVRGRNREALAVFEEALAEARTLGEPAAEAEALTLVAMAKNRVGDPEGAVALARQAYELAGSLGDARRQGSAACLMGVVAYLNGRMGEGRQRLEEALALAERAGDRMGAVAALVNLTGLLVHNGLPEEAWDAGTRVLALVREVGDRRGEALAIANLATLEEGRGRMPEAMALFEQGLALLREVGDRPNEGQTLANMAAVCLAAGQPRRAQELCEAALAIHFEVGARRLEGFTLNLLGSALYHLGRRDQARECYERALQAQRGTDALILDAQVLENLSRLLVELGDLDRAEELCREGIDVCERLGDRRWLGKLRLALAHLREAQDRLEEARQAARDAVSDLAAVADARGEGEARLYLAQRERAEGILDQAASELARARELLTGPTAGALGCAVEAGHQALARGEPARAFLEEAARLLAELDLPEGSPGRTSVLELAAAVDRLPGSGGAAAPPAR